MCVECSVHGDLGFHQPADWRSDGSTRPETLIIQQCDVRTLPHVHETDSVELKSEYWGLIETSFGHH